MLEKLNLYLNSLDAISEIEYQGAESQFECYESYLMMIFDCDAAPIGA